jgi:hypothetical protein
MSFPRAASPRPNRARESTFVSQEGREGSFDGGDGESFIATLGGDRDHLTQRIRDAEENRQLATVNPHATFCLSVTTLRLPALDACDIVLWRDIPTMKLRQIGESPLFAEGEPNGMAAQS